MAGNYQTKRLTVKKLGWRRIAKNTMRFGWVMDEAIEHDQITETHSFEGNVVGDTIYINEKVDTKHKVRIEMAFYRYPSQFANLGAISVLEFFYNLIFTLRRILAFLFPIAFVAAIALMFIGLADLGLKIGAPAMGAAFVWLIFIILENIMARIAARRLRYKN